ncbi:DUF4349 domain-containing protein [Streptomyces sp. MNU76]|uniref:DUF4349 domain-containing protein n=1 Tax=Streptomyces sp. MNU76 TaxID=2560026 RepID=UPI001E6464DE|nr:DUF4349 domain-containing protein [Streptomyces sp. MNU76]MCC9705152.1 DUF4349 domain-containing protein [Streptomyces sp. MNU76]
MAEAHGRRSRRPAAALAALFLAAALAVTGCSGDRGDATSGQAKSAADDGAARQEGALSEQSGSSDYTGKGKGSEVPNVSPSHIIRTATLTVRVKDVPKALDEARTAVEGAGGFVGSESTTRDGKDRERTRVVLRVPAEKYEEVLTELEGTGKLIERKTNAEDVTDQVVDVESRIKTQRASVTRIRELMDKATKLGDVVTLEGELSTRQADLESLLAQQKSLKDRTSLATITLSLSETAVKKAAVDDPGFADALAGGWNAFVAVFRWLGLALAAVLPFAVAAALLLLVWYRLSRSRRPAPAVATTGAAASLPASAPDEEERQERE